MPDPSLPPIAERFLRYVQINTQSDPESDTTPSTDGQKTLGRLLVEELQALGLSDAAIDEHDYVYATLPSPRRGCSAPDPRPFSTPRHLSRRARCQCKACGARKLRWQYPQLAWQLLAAFLTALPATEAPETTSGRAGYLHPHRLSGGDASHAEAKLLVRDFSEQGLQRRIDLLDALTEQLRLKHPKAEISLTVEKQYKNMRTYIEDCDERAIRFAFAAARKMGLGLKSGLVRGGTDGARLSEKGLPTPNVFTGGYDFHSRFEWNSVENIQRALAFTKALVRYWGTHGRGKTTGGADEWMKENPRPFRTPSPLPATYHLPL